MPKRQQRGSRMSSRCPWQLNAAATAPPTAPCGVPAWPGRTASALPRSGGAARRGSRCRGAAPRHPWRCAARRPGWGARPAIRGRGAAEAGWEVARSWQPPLAAAAAAPCCRRPSCTTARTLAGCWVAVACVDSRLSGLARCGRRRGRSREGARRQEAARSIVGPCIAICSAIAAQCTRRRHV